VETGNVIVFFDGGVACPSTLGEWKTFKDFLIGAWEFVRRAGFSI